jgi:hypothetical protein
MKGQSIIGGLRQRKPLQFVLGLMLLGVALWLTPLMMGRPAPATRVGEPLAAAATSAPLPTEPFPALSGTGDDARALQQVEIARQELVEREQLVAAQTAALRAGLQHGFWARQMLVGLCTILLAVGTVAYLLQRGVGWSTLRARLRSEEARLHELQLSVIGALQELESTLATARDAAPDEARRAPRSMPVAPPEPRPSSEPVALPDLRPARAPIAPPDLRPSPASIALSDLQPRPEPAAMPVLGARVRAVPFERGDAPGRAPAAPIAAGAGWAERFLAREPLTVRETLVSREPFVARDALMPRGSGLTGGPIRRDELPLREVSEPWPSQPEPLAPASARPVPSMRAQIEYLSAGGLGETEIARRLRLSREEVRLALALEGQSESRTRRTAGA